MGHRKEVTPPQTPRGWCRLHKLSYDHPEAWTDANRDAYLKWRLSERSRFWRTKWSGMAPRERQLTIAAFKHMITESVRVTLQERSALTRQRYMRCQCILCRRRLQYPGSAAAWRCGSLTSA